MRGRILISREIPSLGVRQKLPFVARDDRRNSLLFWRRNLFLRSVVSLPYSLLLAFCSPLGAAVEVRVGLEIPTCVAGADLGRVNSKSRFASRRGVEDGAAVTLRCSRNVASAPRAGMYGKGASCINYKQEVRLWRYVANLGPSKRAARSGLDLADGDCDSSKIFGRWGRLLRRQRRGGADPCHFGGLLCVGRSRLGVSGSGALDAGGPDDGWLPRGVRYVTPQSEIRDADGRRRS